jgi:hypothetical protein
MLSVSAFACSVLAAFGAERVLAGKGTARYAAVWMSFALFLALLASTGVLTNVAMAIAGETRAELITANAGHIVGGAWRSAVAVSAVVVVMLAVARGALTATRAGWVLAVVVAVAAIVIIVWTTLTGHSGAEAVWGSVGSSAAAAQ